MAPSELTDHVAPFGALLEEPLRNGLTRPKSVRGSGTKMVNMGELFANPRIARLLMDRVPLSEDERARFLLRPGDLLFARQSLVLSGAGKCSLFVGDDEPVTFESHLIRARLDRARAEPAFYFYFFQSSLGRAAIESIVEQVAAAGIRGSDLARLRVPVPPISTQHAIVEILQALDDKIDINRSIGATLETMARALFKSWFVEVEALDPDAGHVPVGWSRSVLGDHVTLQRGTTYSGKLVGQPGPALLGLGSIQPGGGFREGRYKTYGGECPPHLTLFPGDLYAALKGATKDGTMVGSIARVPPSVPSGRLTQDTVKLDLRSQIRGFDRYLYWLLLTPHYRAYCAGRITGSAQVGLSREDFLAYPVPVPPLQLLERFERVETSFSRRIDAANEESTTLAALRDALLPKLVSGELRIREVESVIGTAV